MDAGWIEGVARTISQMITHPFEQRKIQLQVHGCTGKGISFRGIFQTSLASGFVYTSYYSFYRTLGETNQLSSTVSAVLNSFIKTPIHNSMRYFFAVSSMPNLVCCVKDIYKKNGLRGLYSGYRVNIAEDIIEMNIRDGIYERYKIQKPLRVYNWEMGPGMFNGMLGAFAGSLAAAATTPFDVMKSNLLYHTGRLSVSETCALVKGKMFHGVSYRFCNNIMRYFVFYYVCGLWMK